MIEDLFFKRYQHTIFYTVRDGSHLHPEVQRILLQATQIFDFDIHVPLGLGDQFFENILNKFAREFGSLPFPVMKNPYDACGLFLNERYDLWNDRHGSGDIFVKLRLSLIELLFRYAEKEVEIPVGGFKEHPKSLITAPRLPNDHHSSGEQSRLVREHQRRTEAVRKAVQELNARFRAASLPFHYHNGMIQYAQDDLSQDRIAEPFWSVTRDPKWKNVDDDMKRAVDLADTGGHDPALYASMALESTVKIISDEKGWTTGKEKGAAGYINNLVSAKNGRFIEVWEMEALIWFFSKIRNPHGHGPGSAPPLTLTDHQTKWAIESSMSWIKSLIQRM